MTRLSQIARMYSTLTVGTSESGLTQALVSTIKLNAVQRVIKDALMQRAVSNLLLTLLSHVANRADAHKRVHQVIAGAIIPARTIRAFVNLLVAVFTRKAAQTLAVVLSALVVANDTFAMLAAIIVAKVLRVVAVPSVLAWRTSALVAADQVDASGVVLTQRVIAVVSLFVARGTGVVVAALAREPSELLVASCTVLARTVRAILDRSVAVGAFETRQASAREIASGAIKLTGGTIRTRL